MQPQSTKFFTGSLSADTLLILASDYVIEISILVVSGTVEITGSASLKNVASQPIPLSQGNTLTVTGTDANSPIENLLIDATSGSCNIITKQ